MLPPPSYIESTIAKRGEGPQALATNIPAAATMAPTAMPSSTPPPSYIASQTHLNTNLSTQQQAFIRIPDSIPLNNSNDEDDDEYGYDDDDYGVDADRAADRAIARGPAAQQPASAPAPIVIKVNTGIKVDGDGNSLLLPSSSMAPAPAQQQSRSTAATQLGSHSTSTTAAGNDAQTQTSSELPAGGLPTPGLSPTSDRPPNTPSAGTSNSGPSVALPKTDAHMIAASILAALKASGLISQTPSTGQANGIQQQQQPRPIEINIEAGIKVNGSRNLVTRGVPSALNGLKILRRPDGSNAFSIPTSGGDTANRNSGSSNANNSSNLPMEANSGKMTRGAQPGRQGESQSIAAVGEGRHGDGDCGVSRKRRAESEPASFPPTKKTHVSFSS